MSRIVTLEIEDNGSIYISDECSSGAEYNGETPEEISKAVIDYLTAFPTYVDYDKRSVEIDYDLECGELDGVSIRDAEKIVGEEDGALDCYIFYDEDDSYDDDYFDYNDDYGYDPDDDYYRDDYDDFNDYDDTDFDVLYNE